MVVGGWSDETKLILISTLVEVVVEVEVELCKKNEFCCSSPVSCLNVLYYNTVYYTVSQENYTGYKLYSV